MSQSGHIFSLFSNLWFYIGSGDETTDIEHITKIKHIHGITKAINLDTKTAFWSNTISKYSEYDPAIAAQLSVHNNNQLRTVYDKLTSMITSLLIKPSNLTKYGKPNDHVILFYTINPLNSECLLGLYLSYLCKTTCMDIKSATEVLKTKIQLTTPGGQRSIVRFSNDMKKFLYLQYGSSQ